MVCYVPQVEDRDWRERLIDATLDLSARCGYEAVSVAEIAAAADLTPPEFVRYFATKDAVVLSIVEDLVQAIAAALRHAEAAASPERALLIATTEVLSAIATGSGVITLDRMLAMARVVGAHPDLRRRASLLRRRVLTPALAELMGVAAENRRVRRAVMMWSAIVSGAYLDRHTMADHYDPVRDDQLEQRMITELAASFAEVMGEIPSQRD
jgi:AcrR family transcriptional regulator